MRKITKKQLKSIWHMMDFIEYQQKDYISDNDIQWKQTLQEIKNMVRNGKLQQLGSTDKITQRIFNFLIRSTQLIQHRAKHASITFNRRTKEGRKGLFTHDEAAGSINADF